jgi:glycosyltransferase involved in cell wall biosynthesis
VEVIIVDDGSSDGSQDEINEIVRTKPGVRTILHQENKGYCRSFNEAFRLSSGSFIIDLAADDFLLPERAAVGIEAFTSGGSGLGVHHTDAECVAPGGDKLYLHSDQHPHETIPQGDVYERLIERYFICSPSMMIRREVLEEMGGYDESLDYEDFDLWVRSSRHWQYAYTSVTLVRKRILPHSLSSRQRSVDRRSVESTLRVCRKIFEMSRSPGEFRALMRRALYEARVCARGFRFSHALRFLGLAARSWRKAR